MPWRKLAAEGSQGQQPVKRWSFKEAVRGIPTTLPVKDISQHPQDRKVLSEEAVSDRIGDSLNLCGPHVRERLSN